MIELEEKHTPYIECDYYQGCLEGNGECQYNGKTCDAEIGNGCPFGELEEE